jgi:SAM-dependent methyltransferase
VKGCIEDVRTDLVKGWAFDALKPDVPPRVRVLLDDAVIAEDLAVTDRPDVARAMGVKSATCGFRMKVSLDSDVLAKVAVQASTGGSWVDMARVRPPQIRRHYQDFDGTGSSKSHEKLKALRLESIHGGKLLPGRSALAGKSVLDIGCNEGFFCAEALRQGAKRVVGIDFKKQFVESARARVKGAKFIHASWWDLPDEKFDVILFLSAIHYEPEQKKLLDKLAGHLTDDGVLVLECGVKGGAGKKQWHLVPRWDGAKRYPSLDLLRRELLSQYAVRWIGPSVNQGGDPVPRFVFHCKLRRPVAMVIAGPSQAGKSALAHELLEHGLPHYDSDTALAKLLMHEENSKLPLAQALIAKFGKGRPKNLSLVGKYVVDANLCDEFVSMVLKEIPAESRLFVIEGEIFRHTIVQTTLFKQLAKAGIRAWLVGRGN